MSKEERKAALLRFHRSLKASSSARGNRTSKCPADLCARVKAECASTQGLDYWFNQWMQSDHEWGRVVLQEKATQISRTTKLRQTQWLMRHEMIAKYGDEEEVDAMLADLARLAAERLIEDPLSRAFERLGRRLGRGD